MSAKTHDGRTIRMLTLIDEYTRECSAVRVARKLGRYEVIEALADVILYRGIPAHIRSDNAPEFGQGVAGMASEAGDRDTVHRTRESRENGYCESFNRKLRDERLNGEIFLLVEGAPVVIENVECCTTPCAHIRRSATGRLPLWPLPPLCHQTRVRNPWL